MCNCRQRRDAIITIVKSASVGKTEHVMEQVRIITRSVSDDVATFRSKIASAKSRLARR